MASLSRDKNGTKRIQWVDSSGNRHTIRLGKINMKMAESFLSRLERLIASKLTGTAVDGHTAQWLAELPNGTYSKLVGQGLADAREAVVKHTLGTMLNEYFETASVKNSTLIRYGQTKRLLIEHFDEGRSLDTITPREADQWKTWLKEKSYAQATISRNVGIARMFFRQAMRWEMIPSNPFDGVRAGAQTNRKRLTYLSPLDTQKLIDAAPNSDWRCIIALARYGGLRCPTEVLGVYCADVDWAQNRLRVRSPKTEHHAGKGERLVPLFPELRAVLIQAFEIAPDGTDRIVSGYATMTTNLRTHMNRIIRRTGLIPWPRMFNAMRASRATELASEYPAAICTAWLGHTQAVAEAHYHMVRDSDYERAAHTPIGSQSGAECGALVSQNAAQHEAAPSSNKSQPRTQTKKRSAFMPISSSSCDSLQSDRMSVTGLEPVTSAM